MAAKKAPPAYDLGRRVAAARAYRNLDQVTVAKRLKMEPATLGRYEKGEIPELVRRGLVEKSSLTLKLPEEFFLVNLAELPLMAEAWKQVQRLPRPEDLERLVDAVLSAEQPTG
jgi:transcriptional regulator with XRE-family HTH domain